MVLLLTLVGVVGQTGLEPADQEKYADAVRMIREGSQKDFASASEVLNALAKKSPRCAEVFAARCSAQMGLRAWQQAANDCSYALSLKPGLISAVYAQATAEKNLGHVDKARQLFTQYVESDDPQVVDDLRDWAQRFADELTVPLDDEAPRALEQAPTAPPVVKAAASKNRAPEAAVEPPPPGTCRTRTDCAPGKWCKAGGDGQKVCMGKGGQDAACQRDVDCLVPGVCKRRGDDVTVCMNRGPAGAFCNETKDCGNGLLCAERADGLRSCRRP